MKDERASLLRVMDARHCQLVEAAWEENGLWVFRQDLVRVLQARVRKEGMAMVQELMRGALLRVLRGRAARLRYSLAPRTVGCPRCIENGVFSPEDSPDDCPFCNGAFVCWMWQAKMENGYDVLVCSPQYPRAWLEAES